MSLIYPVILSGGTGSRLWPLSRSQSPKQLLPLLGADTMLQNTLTRVRGPEYAAPTIVCHADHRFVVAEQIRQAGIANPTILLEPVGRSTAPAVTIAALTIVQHDPEALLLVMPADHAVRDASAFAAAMTQAALAAGRGRLVTFGIVPTSPESGYGYIRRGAALADSQTIFAVSQFVEKPPRALAEQYLAAGDYLWNSGMFVFRAGAYLDELARLEPGMLTCCQAAVTQGRRDADYFRIAAEPFARCRTVSIDHAMMERTDKAVVVPATMGWNDIGSWEALWSVSAKDEANNVCIGDVLQHESHDSYLRSEGPLLAAVGVENLAVVATWDSVLVCAKDKAQNVKMIVERLERDDRGLHIHHPAVAKPWGSYESLDRDGKFQVKHIIVKPGAKLSLQMHHSRAEHWVVVAGTAIVTCGDKVFTLQENESTFIPLGATHRLENGGAEPLHLIEVQYGSYLGEDDIVRFEDSYGR
jgi:mannose-1-phosphate guanylyltransferase/mannose-6-phosphate isomerase